MSEQPPTLAFSWFSRVILGLLHLATSAWLVSFSVLLYRRVEIRHPVFGVIFQDVVVMALTVVIPTAASPLAFVESGAWLEMSTRFCSVCAVFHQISWLTVSVLRVYLIRKGPQEDIPPSLLRVSVLATWVMFFAMSAVFHQMTTLLYSPAGQDDEAPAVILIVDKWRSVLKIFILLAVINSPDVVSVLIYVGLWLHKRRNSSHVAAIEQINENSSEEEYGGIYVGPPAEQQNQAGPQVVLDPAALLPGQVPAADREEATPRQQQQQQPVNLKSQGSAAQQVHGQPTTPSPEVSSALRALKIYSLTCLLDLVVIPLNALLPPNEYQVAANYAALFVLYYWLPVVSMAANFGKLREMFFSLLNL